MSNRRVFITILLSIIYGFSYAQILDDSTKQVYGIKTTRYILEEDILNNRKTNYNPDTLLDNFHLFEWNLRSSWLYQDLGNMGSANRPLFFEPNEQIGKQLGFLTYGLYAFDATKVKYYNTKSPYTNLNYVQSGGGTGMLHLTHSQNLTPRLNLGLEVRRLSTSRQYGAPRTREERLVDSWSAMFHSNYESKNGKYILLGNYNHFNHAPLEQGGIRPLTDSTEFIPTESLGNYRDYLSKLTNASSRDWRNELHIYHQYLLSNTFQVYHILDYQRRIDYYFDNSFNADSAATVDFYKKTPSSFPDTLTVALRYRLLENKFGVKGIYRGFAYRLYLRQRLYNLTSNFGDDFRIKLKSETLVGAWANYFFPDSVRRAYAEAELGSNLNLRLKAEYISPKIRLSFLQISVPATLLDERFMSAVYVWNKPLRNQFSNNLSASSILRRGGFAFLPSVNYSLIKNYIYYDQAAQIAQTSVPISIFKIGLGIEYRWRRLSIMNQSYFAINSEEQFIRMPKLANNTRIGYEFVYAKRLHINTGIDIYYRTAYSGDNYMPLTRQFFLQDNQQVWGYPVADVFANLKISKVRLFFKFAHVNQGLFKNGYYVSSTYPGLQRTFFLGVNWPLFD